MKQALTKVFQYYGPILDIIAKSSLKRKGQAFIVFDSEKAALEAIEEMSGFELYGKPIKVHRSKTHSDETVKRKAADMFDEHKRKRLMLKGTCLPCRMSLGAWSNHLQTSSEQKKTRRRKPTQPSPLRSLALPKPELLLSPTNTCGRTRHCSFRTSPATSTKTTSRPYSSASKASRRSAWFRSGLWPLPNLRTSSSRSQQKRRRRTHLLVRRASQ